MGGVTDDYQGINKWEFRLQVFEKTGKWRRADNEPRFGEADDFADFRGWEIWINGNCAAAGKEKRMVCYGPFRGIFTNNYAIIERGEAMFFKRVHHAIKAAMEIVIGPCLVSTIALDMKTWAAPVFLDGFTQEICINVIIH